MEQQRCHIVDSDKMRLASEQMEGMERVAIGPWAIAVPEEELQSEGAILALGLLYDKSEGKNDPSTLYVFFDGERAVLAIFGDELRFRVAAGDDPAAAIEEYLRSLYAAGYPHFVERVVVFAAAPLDAEALRERLLLDIEVESVELDTLCEQPGSHRIAVQKKGPSPLRRLLFVAAAAILIFLAIYDIYLRYESERLSKSLSLALDAQVSLANEKNRIDSKVLQLEAIRPAAAKVQNSADLLAQRLRNLFDLVPDDTYLERFVLKKDGVELAGVAAKRESFEEQIDRKISANYRKESGRVVKGKEGYRFEASYREVRDE